MGRRYRGLLQRGGTIRIARHHMCGRDRGPKAEPTMAAELSKQYRLPPAYSIVEPVLVTWESPRRASRLTTLSFRTNQLRNRQASATGAPAETGGPSSPGVTMNDRSKTKHQSPALLSQRRRVAGLAVGSASITGSLRSPAAEPKFCAIRALGTA